MNLPLYCVTLCGLYDLEEHLFDKHPEYVNARGGQSMVLLVAALYKKHFKAAVLLHQHGADANARDEYGWTPLHRAAHQGHLEIV